MKILKLLNKKFFLLILIFGLNSQAEEKPIDIWNIENKEEEKILSNDISNNSILENTEKKEFDTQKFSEFEDQFQWFILIGFLFVFIDIFMRDGKTIWLKNLNLFNEK